MDILGGGINDLALHPTFCTVASAGERPPAVGMTHCVKID